MVSFSSLGKCNGPVEIFGKQFCLSMVHLGVAKCLSNESILDNYHQAMQVTQLYIFDMKIVCFSKSIIFFILILDHDCKPRHGFSYINRE